jgi:hypothetical protein
MHLQGNSCIYRWKPWLDFQRSAAGVGGGVVNDLHGNLEEEKGKEGYIALAGFVPETSGDVESCVCV